jgi:hypothetical protein
MSQFKKRVSQKKQLNSIWVLNEEVKLGRVRVAKDGNQGVGVRIFK